MPAPANLVHQTSTGTGTGNLTVSPVNGKQTFATAFGTGTTTNVFDYFISNQSAAEWERGTGHMSASTTLVRDTVIESSNSNLAVSFGSGTKDIINDVPAQNQIYNPLTTRGDIIVRGASTYQRLGLGSSGQVLESDGTDIVWVQPDWKFLTSGTIANSATSVDIVLTSYTAFRALKFVLTMMPTSAAQLYCRFSTNGGGAYDAAAGNYQWGGDYSQGGAGGTGSGSATQIVLSAGQSCSITANSGGYDLEATIIGQTNAGKLQFIYATGDMVNSTGTGTCISGNVGNRAVAQDTDAIRFLWSTGNFNATTPGKYALYGLM